MKTLALLCVVAAGAAGIAGIYWLTAGLAWLAIAAWSDDSDRVYVAEVDPLGTHVRPQAPITSRN